MDDLSIMNILNCAYDLLNNSWNILLVAFELGKKLPSLHILHEQEDMVFIVEVSIKFYYVGMIEHV